MQQLTPTVRCSPGRMKWKSMLQGKMSAVALLLKMNLPRKREEVTDDKLLISWQDRELQERESRENIHGESWC